MTAGEGFDAGAQNYVASLGSQGEQVASAMQSTIGATVSSISEGIYGWITGTQSFGDVLMNLGGTVLQTMLQTIVQMGVQWVINGAIGRTVMMAFSALGSMLKKKETAETIASEGTKTPVLMANAAAANAGSWGLSAVIGLALMVALMAAFGAFSSGGYTGPGGVYEPAGIVHKGEVVFSQADISRAGGVNNVEAMRANGGSDPTLIPVVPGAAPSPVTAGGAAGTLAVGAMMAAAVASTAAASKPSRTIVVDSRSYAEKLRDDPAFFTIVQEMVTGNPGAFGIPS